MSEGLHIDESSGGPSEVTSRRGGASDRARGSGRKPDPPATVSGATRELFALIESDPEAATALLRADHGLGAALTVDYALPMEEGEPALSFDEADVLSVGARTVVIKAHTCGRGVTVPTRPVVLKLARPEARDDPITRAELRQEHRLSATRVLVHGADYHFLISELAPGVPILSWLRARGWLESDSEHPASSEYDARIDAAADIGSAICAALAELQRRAGSSHGNLSFSGVMVDEAVEGIQVSLIDAGAEYRDAERLEPTDAPLLASGGETGGELSDAHALGVILLQVLTPEPIRYGRLQGPLARAWTTCPELARVIEDLVDAKPSQRMVMLNSGGHSSRWTALGDWIARERRLARLFRPSSDVLGGGTSEASISSWGQVRRYFAVATEVKLAGDADWPGYDLLKYVNLASYALWVLCLTGFVVLTSADIGLSVPDGEAARVINNVGHFRIGNITENFPGRALALSFSYAALTFYSRVLATVSARRLGVPLIEGSMRAVPFIFQLPAVYVIYYDPQAWPIAASIGVLATAIVNGFIRNLDRRALHAMDVPLGYTEEDIAGARRQREPYRSWGRTAGIYLVLLLAFDFLLYRYQILRDDWFYALGLALGANYYVLYWNSIRKLGPVVHGALERSTFILRRAARVTGAIPSPFSDSAYPGGVLVLAPAAAVLSVALGATAGDRRWLEVGLGLVAVLCLSIGGAIVLAHREAWETEGNTKTRVSAVAMLSVGLWLLVIVMGRFLFDVGVGSAVTALVGAAGASMLAYWVLQAPESGRLADDELVGEIVTQAARDAVRSLSTEALATHAGRRRAATALLDAAGEGIDRAELEQRVEQTWTQSPRLGRAVERMLGLRSELAFADTEVTSIAQARHDAEDEWGQSVWEWRRLSPTDRARCSLADPAGVLTRVQAAGVWASQLLSWLIVSLCSVGFVYYVVTDANWQRTPERFLALTYCVGAVAFQQILIGWVSVAQVAWLRHGERVGAEAALRMVPLVFQGPAVAAIFVDPDLWPVWATIGITSTAIINLMLQLLVRESLVGVVRGQPVEEEKAERELASRAFSTWWITASAYSALLITFDLLITATGGLHDRGFFAACLAAGVNLYVIVYNSLYKRGREVRGQVLRAVVTLSCLPERVSPNGVREEEGLLAAEGVRVGGPIPLGVTFAINAVLLVPFAFLLGREGAVDAAMLGIGSTALILAATALSAAGRARAGVLPVSSDVFAAVALACWMWGAALGAAALAVWTNAGSVGLQVGPVAFSIAAALLVMVARRSPTGPGSGGPS